MKSQEQNQCEKKAWQEIRFKSWANLKVLGIINLKAYNNLLQFMPLKMYYPCQAWQEIQFQSLAKSETKSVWVFCLKAYDNLLEFKATENVFSMSNVWQEIGFKSWANFNVLEIFNSKAYNNLLEFKSLSKSNAMCVLKHFIWKSISKSRKWSINTKDIFVFFCFSFRFS